VEHNLHSKTGVLYAPQGVVVTLGNAYMPGGIIDGAGEVIVKNGSFGAFSEGANELYISRLNLTIDGPFWLNLGQFNFKNGGNLIFTANANVTASTSLTTSGTGPDDTLPSTNSQILNYETFNLFDASEKGSTRSMPHDKLQKHYPLQAIWWIHQGN